MLLTRQHSSVEWALGVEVPTSASSGHSTVECRPVGGGGGAFFEASSARNAASLMRRQVHGRVSRARVPPPSPSEC